VYLQAVGVSSQTPDLDEPSARIERPDMAVWAGVAEFWAVIVRVDESGLSVGQPLGFTTAAEASTSQTVASSAATPHSDRRAC